MAVLYIFLLFWCSCACCDLVLFSETKGHSLEEIAEVFDGTVDEVDEEKIGKKGVEHAEYVDWFV